MTLLQKGKLAAQEKSLLETAAAVQAETEAEHRQTQEKKLILSVQWSLDLEKSHPDEILKTTNSIPKSPDTGGRNYITLK